MDTMGACVPEYSASLSSKTWVMISCCELGLLEMVRATPIHARAGHRHGPTAHTLRNRMEGTRLDVLYAGEQGIHAHHATNGAFDGGPLKSQLSGVCEGVLPTYTRLFSDRGLKWYGARPPGPHVHIIREPPSKWRVWGTPSDKVGGERVGGFLGH